jgi:hypothetical protein
MKEMKSITRIRVGNFKDVLCYYSMANSAREKEALKLFVFLMEDSRLCNEWEMCKGKSLRFSNGEPNES